MLGTNSLFRGSGAAGKPMAIRCALGCSERDGRALRLHRQQQGYSQCARGISNQSTPGHVLARTCPVRTSVLPRLVLISTAQIKPKGLIPRTSIVDGRNM